MKIFDDFNFESNDFKNHAYNIKKISNWYFNPSLDGESIPEINITINTCLEILAIAHGFKTYIALKTALTTNSGLESIQTNQTYFDRLINADLNALFGLSEIGVGLAYSQIDHFFDMCASYIIDVNMDLNTLNGPSNLNGIVLHADVSVLRFFNLKNRSFLAAAFLNTVLVSHYIYEFPCTFTLPKKYLRQFLSYHYSLKNLYTFEKFDFTFDMVESLDVRGSNQYEILFDIRLVNFLNEKIYGLNKFVGHHFNSAHLIVDQPPKSPNANTTTCADFIVPKPDYEITSIRYPELGEQHYRSIFETYVLPTTFGDLSHYAVSLALDDDYDSVIENIHEDCLNLSEVLAFLTPCKSEIEFTRLIDIDGHKAELHIRVLQDLLVHYAVTNSYNKIAFEICDIQVHTGEPTFSISMNNDPEGIPFKMDSFTVSALSSGTLPFKDYYIKKVNQKLNKSKYEVSRYYNQLIDTYEKNLI
ncbi:MAG: hypothetical protein PHG15_00695 [Acinetobacter sp.]|uniref:hypothetical protein n=1 Tax=Acinetobacter sp. TaxID=472 RepID=UPI0026126792|nr:hypothetical protein [Acinetobacter sp.]MDD2944336.1 hypothetical protein [Acinetobacter sp.]